MTEKKTIVPALFLHIQKTAGSSLLEAVYRHYKNSFIRHGDYWGHPPEKFLDTLLVSGHFGYEYARHLMQDRFTFTLLREPVERIISLYYFCAGRDPDQFSIYKRARELDFQGFLEAGLTDPLVKMHIWNNQVWQLAYGYFGPHDNRTSDDFSAESLLEMAKQHLQQFSFVGFTETIDPDGMEILSALNIPSGAGFPKINITEARPQASDLSTKEKAMLHDLTYLDRQLYEYARQMKMPAESKLAD